MKCCNHLLAVHGWCGMEIVVCVIGKTAKDVETAIHTC